MFRKKFLKIQALVLAVVVIGMLFQSGLVLAKTENGENIIYKNDFETDSQAVFIGNTKAIEFFVKGDATNSWDIIFLHDLATEYNNKIYAGAALSFDLYLPKDSTFTGELKALAVTKMGSALKWTQSQTIENVGIDNFIDSGDGYLKTSVSIPFGSEIEEVQGLRSVVPCLAASICDYKGKIYLDNVKFVNDASAPEEPEEPEEPVVQEVIYQNDFETDAKAVEIGKTKALEYNAKGDATNSWDIVFLQDLAREYTSKIYSGATLSFDLYLPAGTTYKGLLKAMAITKVGSFAKWVQSSTISDIEIGKFKDSGDGYLKTSVSIPFGSEIEEIRGLTTIVPCVVASNCDYAGKVYLDNVKFVNGSITDLPESTPIVWDFSKAEDIKSWTEGKSYSYSGGMTISYDDQVCKGAMALELDYSKDSNETLSVAEFTYAFPAATLLEDYNQFSFDVVYDPAKMTEGYLMAKLNMSSFYYGIDKNTTFSDEEDYGNGLKKAKAVINFKRPTEPFTDFTIGIIGSSTNYKGPIYIDNVTFDNYYVLATKKTEVQTPVTVTSDSITANKMLQNTLSKVQLTDDKATLSAAKLYAYLEAVGKTDSVLFGHQNDTINKMGNVSLSKSDVEDVTGSIAAVMGIDVLSLSGFEPSIVSWKATLAERVAANAKVTKEAVDKGAIITLSAHMPNFDSFDKRIKNAPEYGDNPNLPSPKNLLSDGSYNFYGNSSEVCTGNVVSRIMPGQDLNKYYTAYLDMIAEYAKALEKDDISLLFRPFHENTGNRFWWGKAFCDAEAYINLYRYTVNYLRDIKGVHNFLYVYSPGWEATSTAEYAERYPGDAYVDMVGFDMYHKNPAEGDNFISSFISQLNIAQEFAKQHNKLFAVTETGVDNGNQKLLEKNNPRKDWFNEILDAVADTTASYFMVGSNIPTDKIIINNKFYTPYVDSDPLKPMKGHEMLDNFIDFYNKPNSVFANQKGDYTQLNVTVQASTYAAGYIMSPVSGSHLLDVNTLEANVTNPSADSVVKFIAKNKTGGVVKEIPAVKNSDGNYIGSLTKEMLQELGESVGSISLSVNGQVINKINAIFNIPEPIVDPTVIDLFEDYNGDNEVLNSTWAVEKGIGCSLVPALSNKNYEGKYGLEFKYSLVANGYVGIVKFMDNFDWSGKNAIQFWTIPDGKNQEVVIQIKSGGGIFEVCLNDYDGYYSSEDPVLVTIPFSSFVYRNDDGFDPYYVPPFMSPAYIESFGLLCNTIVPAGQDASTYKLDSVLYYDSIKAVTSDVQTVTFDKLLNVDEVTMGDINEDDEVNSIDYGMLRCHLLGQKYIIGTYALKAADINKDGNINSVDFAFLRRYLLTGKF